MISLPPLICCVPFSTDHRFIERHLLFFFSALLTVQLNRCYDDPSYVPSSAFVVQYSMIMAIAARVRPPAFSHCPGVTPSHYTVASATTKPNPSPANITSRPPSKIPHDQFYNRMLPYFPDLLHEPSLPDLQALLLLMVYLIGIYKMGHLWHLSRIVSAIAYELGLHRSDANWTNLNPLEREMRKRVFFLTVGLDLKVAK
jgi:Fungal specific transcription factor domain